MKNISTNFKYSLCTSALILAAGLALSPAQAGQDTFASGVTGGAEVSLLKPFQTEDTISGFGYDAATRIWIGYQGSNGLGVRARWWQYDERSSDPASNFTRLKMQTYDLEATKAFKLGNMTGLISGGLRFAEYREEDGGGPVIVPSSYGLVAGLELRKPIFGRFSLFGEARQSFMVDGAWTDEGSPGRNITFAISELKLGVEYAYPLMNSGLDLFGRLAGEAQFWNGVSDSDSESIGLSGVTLTLGIRAGGDSDRNDDAANNDYSSGFTAGTEVSLLKPYQTEHSPVGFGRDAAYLGWIGYQGSSGLGARARWWQYDERSSNPASGISRLKFETMDFEVTQAFMLGNMQGLVSGGLRLAEYREDNSGALEASTPSAYGLVAGVELRRPVYGRFSLFGLARQSIMFDNQLLDGGATPERNATFTTSELSLGVEYAYPLMQTGLDVFGRVAAQAQYWNGISDTDSEAAGLFGAALTLGIRAGGENASDKRVILRDYPRGVTVGAEVSLLKPFQSERDATGFGYSPATLVWAGYQSDSGLGIRGRWWRYKENSSNPGASNIDTLKMETFDVEATQAFMLGSLEGTISGGVRFAEFREDGNDPNVPSAFGLVASLEVKRNLFGGLSVFGEGRHALMFDNRWDDGSPSQNVTFTISEAKIGLRYDQPIFGDRANLFGKVAAAGQYWGGISNDDTENLGLFGVAFELGLSAEF